MQTKPTTDLFLFVVLAVCIGCGTGHANRGATCRKREYTSDRPQHFSLDSKKCTEFGRPKSRRHEACLRDLGWGPLRQTPCKDGVAEGMTQLTECYASLDDPSDTRTAEDCKQLQEELFPNHSLEVETK